MAHYDHLPLLVKLEVKARGKQRKKKCFRFEPFWVKKEGTRIWGSKHGMGKTGLLVMGWTVEEVFVVGEGGAQGTNVW